MAPPYTNFLGGPVFWGQVSVGDECFYTQELFEKEEFTGHLKNTMESEKSVYDRIAYDSAGVEKGFAQGLEKNEAVKVYAKLSGWFITQKNTTVRTSHFKFVIHCSASIK